MYSSAIANLEQRVENLEEKNNKQAEEINILKAVLNNICESIREDKEKINTLMLQKDVDDKADDEDFIKAQELIDKENGGRSMIRDDLEMIRANMQADEVTLLNTQITSLRESLSCNGKVKSVQEIYNQMKVTQIDPVEAEYYRQMDKAIKDTKEEM